MLASIKNSRISLWASSAVLSVAVGLYCLPSKIAFAAEKSTYSSDTLKNSSDKMTGVSITSGATPDDVPSVGVPNVSIDVAEQYVERKGFDVIGLMQTFAQPFTIALFIFGAFLALVGAFGKTGAVLKGVIVMALAVVIYAVVLYAPQLMDLGNAWLKS